MDLILLCLRPIVKLAEGHGASFASFAFISQQSWLDHMISGLSECCSLLSLCCALIGS